jgi:hypothetical protein
MQDHPVVARYMASFEASIAALDPGERLAIAQEIRNHIAEATAAGKPLDDVLRSLGPAETLARAYVVELLMNPRTQRLKAAARIPEAGGDRRRRRLCHVVRRDDARLDRHHVHRVRTRCLRARSARDVRHPFAGRSVEWHSARMGHRHGTTAHRHRPRGDGSAEDLHPLRGKDDAEDVAARDRNG